VETHCKLSTTAAFRWCLLENAFGIASRSCVKSLIGLPFIRSAVGAGEQSRRYVEAPAMKSYPV
jgi:hypothetical protein